MRKRVGWLLVGAGVLTAGLGYRIFTTYWDFGKAADELPDAIRDYRAVGLPWVASDLQSEKVSEKENAAGPIRKAIALRPGPRVDRALDAAFDTGIDSPDFPKYARALAWIHEAAQRPELDYRRDWDEGPFLNFPELQSVRQFVRVLSFRALQRARHENDDRAIADLEDARRLAVLTGKEPLSIAGLSAITGEAQVLSTAEKCLALSANDLARLKRYRSWLNQTMDAPDMAKALRFEIYSGIVFARNLDRLGALKSINPADDFYLVVDENTLVKPSMGMRREGIPPNVRAQGYLARNLQQWTELFKKTDGLRASAATIDREWKAIDLRASKKKGLSFRINVILFPIFSQVWQRPKELLAARAKALALADALIEHAQTGHWPTKMSQVDPFTNGPLKIRRVGQGIRIYSVGIDGEDNGGISSWEGRAGPYDLVAAFPPIPRVRRKPVVVSGAGLGD